MIAAFDCDGTLIRGDATRCFLLLLQGRLGIALVMMKLIPQLIKWQLGRRSTAKMKESLLNAALQATTQHHKQKVLHQSLPAELIRLILPETLQRLRWHQQQGHRCLIITASPEPLIQSLANHLNVELIGTRCSDPLITSLNQPFELQSENCKGIEKLRRMESYLGYLPPPEQLEAYGDSKGDRELLRASNRPHYRRFTADIQPYQADKTFMSLLPLLAIGLIALGLRGLMMLSSQQWADLYAAITRLLLWLPLIYGLLAISYLGRYWRWRILLGSCSVGRWSWQDLMGWFQGFALTATPGKLGELNRVQQLHHKLEYPRLPLVHTFVAERLCDGAAVLIWLAVLLPSALLNLKASIVDFTSSTSVLISTGVSLFIACIIARRKLRSILHMIWTRYGHHLPKGAIAQACFPATAVSLAFWATEGLILWLLVLLLSPISISPISGIGIYLFSGTAGLLSSVPGGIGVNEAATTLLLQQFGVPVEIGLPISILRRILTIWSITALAGLSNLFKISDN